MDLSQSRNKLKYINDMIAIENNNYKRLNKVSLLVEFLGFVL